MNPCQKIMLSFNIMMNIMIGLTHFKWCIFVFFAMRSYQKNKDVIGDDIQNPTKIPHKNQANVGKYTSPIDPMGFSSQLCCFTKKGTSPGSLTASSPLEKVPKPLKGSRIVFQASGFSWASC